MNDIEATLSMLFSCYPNTAITEATVAMYVRLLADIPPSELQTVVDQCIASGKFLPTIAELRDKWHSLTRTLCQPSATEGWDEVQRQIRAVGYIGTPTFANPITARLVKTMGWRELCASENVIADRAHFLRMYEQLAERGEQVQKLLPQALAMAERHNGGLQHISAFLPKQIAAEPEKEMSPLGRVFSLEGGKL